MTIDEIIKNRGITNALHFTTNRGLVGIVASGAVKSRRRLPKEAYLEYIYKPNCPKRYDVEWLDYVNLSISRINARLFNISSGKWHKNEDLWWCILSFDPCILAHDGVHFATTNNMYTGVRRAAGAKALERLFDKQILLFKENILIRDPHLPPRCPTCPQAEVLYPGELSTAYLRRIYVVGELHHDIACAQLVTLNHDQKEVVVDPKMFQ